MPIEESRVSTESFTLEDSSDISRIGVLVVKSGLDAGKSFILSDGDNRALERSHNLAAPLIRSNNGLPIQGTMSQLGLISFHNQHLDGRHVTFKQSYFVLQIRHTVPAYISDWFNLLPCKLSAQFHSRLSLHPLAYFLLFLVFVCCGEIVAVI